MSLISVPSTTSNVAASNLPAQMIAISWQINPSTNAYDIYNSFTPKNNAGNLLVIQSKILIILNMFQGEWKAQPTAGIPFNTLNQNSDNPDILAQILVNQILTVQNVNNVTIVSFDYIASTRTFNATFSVNTVFGITTVAIGQ